MKTIDIHPGKDYLVQRGSYGNAVRVRVSSVGVERERGFSSFGSRRRNRPDGIAAFIIGPAYSPEVILTTNKKRLTAKCRNEVYMAKDFISTWEAAVDQAKAEVDLLAKIAKAKKQAKLYNHSLKVNIRSRMSASGVFDQYDLKRLDDEDFVIGSKTISFSFTLDELAKLLALSGSAKSWHEFMPKYDTETESWDA